MPHANQHVFAVLQVDCVVDQNGRLLIPEKRNVDLAQRHDVQLEILIFSVVAVDDFDLGLQFVLVRVRIDEVDLVLVSDDSFHLNLLLDEACQLTWRFVVTLYLLPRAVDR